MKKKVLLVPAILVITIFSTLWLMLSNSNNYLETDILAEESVSELNDIRENQAVIEKGLNWIFENPASFEEDRLLDIIEEIMLFYHIYLASEDIETKEYFKNIIIEKYNLIKENQEIKINKGNEILFYLVLASIADDLNIEVIDFNQLIQNQILNNPQTYPGFPAAAPGIWSSVILENLGYEPIKSPEELVKGSLISKLAKQPELFIFETEDLDDKTIMNMFYEITHEIFALESIGLNKISMFNEEEIEYLKNIIPKGMAKYIEDNEIDILAELIISSKMIGYTDFEEYKKAVGYIIKNQLPDGSFGEIDRMKKMRDNSVRHGVLTSIWALL